MSRLFFHTPAAGLTEEALAAIRAEGLVPVLVSSLEEFRCDEGLRKRGRRALDLEGLAEAAATDLTNMELALKFGVTYPTIVLRLKRLGLWPRRLTSGKSVFTALRNARLDRKATKESRLQLIRERHQEGKTLREVGDELGVTRERVRQLAAEAGVRFDQQERNIEARKAIRCAICQAPVPPSRGNFSSNRRSTCSDACQRAKSRKVHLASIPPETLPVDRILKLRREGYSVGKIAEAIGSTQVAGIQRVLESQPGYAPLRSWSTPLRTAQRAALTARSERIFSLWCRGRTLRDIADELDVSYQTVVHDLRKARKRHAQMESQPPNEVSHATP